MRVIEKAREAVATYESVGELGLVSTYDVLAVVLGPFAKRDSLHKLSSYTIRTLSEMSVQELEQEGLTYNQAVTLHAALLLGKRYSQYKESPKTVIRCPEDVADYLMEEMHPLNQEHFVVLVLNTKNEVTYKKTLFIGSLNASIVHSREVFREAVKKSAASVIVAHNHPSGSPGPSDEDIRVTKHLADSGKMIGIEVLDHVVIGNRRFVSLKEKGYF
ncbi:RadC family protein [Virgibacillus ainsalahensis]